MPVGNPALCCRAAAVAVMLLLGVAVERVGGGAAPARKTRRDF